MQGGKRLNVTTAPQTAFLAEGAAGAARSSSSKLAALGIEGPAHATYGFARPGEDPVVVSTEGTLRLGVVLFEVHH